MKVTIDGQAIEVEPGTTILQAARMIGISSSNVLLFKLKGSGKCRCCLVEVAKGRKLTHAKINGFMCDRMHGWNGSK
jgi:NADH dehydrogenase/NADH:ubiquinone oxidoreductase subunit G